MSPTLRSHLREQKLATICLPDKIMQYNFPQFRDGANTSDMRLVK